MCPATLCLCFVGLIVKDFNKCKIRKISFNFIFYLQQLNYIVVILNKYKIDKIVVYLMQ